MDNFRNRSKELEREKKIAPEAYLKNILDGQGNNWTGFHKYVRRRNGNKEDIPVIRENGNTLITDNRAKADAFNKYFSSVFKNSTDHSFIQGSSVANQFNIEVNVLWNKVKSMKNGKSRGPDDISTDLIKLGGKAILPYLIRIFHVSLNNSKVPEDWKLAFVVPIFKSGDKTKLCNCRPVSLTSVVCKLMKHLVGSYIKKEWEIKKWLCDGQHGFRSGYSCKSQVVQLFQDLADEIDAGGRVDAVVIDFAKAFDVVPHNRLVQKLINSGIDPRVVVWNSEFLRDRKQKVRIGQELSSEARGVSLDPFYF